MSVYLFMCLIQQSLILQTPFTGEGTLRLYVIARSVSGMVWVLPPTRLGGEGELYVNQSLNTAYRRAC